MTEPARLNTMNQGSFPVVNFVLALGTLVSAFVALYLASEAGLLMSHSTSTVGWLVSHIALLAILASIVFEVIAIIRALICLARNPLSRKPAHWFLFVFSIVVFAGFSIFAFGWYR